MPNTPHIPILRLGEPYTSVEQKDVRALGTGEVVARLSMGNAGLVRRDADRFDEARAALAAIPCEDLIALSAEAGRRFMQDTLPLGEDATQSPDDYVRQLAATSGLPHTLVRRNMAKIHDALTHVGDILRGLTRGLPPRVLDEGVGDVLGLPVSFFPTTDALGVVMPSNSPGVNALWLPAIALRTPVILRPGGEEPWTPWRIFQSFYAAGLPREALGFYPSDHEGAAAVMDVCGRSIIFGGAQTVKRYAHDPRVEVHGPGWSKVILGEDVIDEWEPYIDVIVDSIAANSGRSCINASAVLVPRHADALADAVAQRLAAIEPTALDDPNAQLSAIANPAVAQWADAQITQGLRTPGAHDVTAAERGEDPAQRLVEYEGRAYLRPTLIRCDDPSHPLANVEFMFPYASVLEVPREKLIETIGEALVVTAITDDRSLIDELLACPTIHRLNLGPMPTSVAQWDQPHEGNLFDLLYQRRAIQRAAG